MASKGIISIPSELIAAILYRLPSKSIGRFRCVSKEWLSLLSSPEFIKTHQNTLNRNYVFFHLNFMNSPYFILFHHLEETKEEKESILTKFHLQVPNVNLNIYGSCNGLVLLSAFRLCSDHETLMVSNPTTREFVELPDCDIKIEGYKFVSCIMRDLGYDSVTDDYKVVTINYFLNLNGRDRIMCVHVYSFRRNTWTRVIDYPEKYYLDLYYIKSEALVNGSFHWLNTKVSDNKKVIVSFSLADENFIEVPSPTMLGNDVDTLYKTCRIAVVDDKLAIFSVFEGEVWLMNEYGVKGSWTKIKLYGLEQIPNLFESFVFYVNGKLLLVCEDEMIICDTEDGRLSKRIDTCGNTYFSCVCVESLVSPRFQSVRV